MDQNYFRQEFGCDAPVVSDLELLLNHLSKVRVAAEFNTHAEDCMAQYEQGRDKIHLIDARGYVMDALRVAPRQHPEAGRANKNLGLLLLAREKPNQAKVCLHRAVAIYRKQGQVEMAADVLEIIEKRTSSLRWA